MSSRPEIINLIKNSMKESLLKLHDLGLDYLNYSRELFGWQNTYISKEDTTLTTNYINNQCLYFAENSDHRAIYFGDLKINYYPTPTFEMEMNTDLEKVFSEYSELLVKIKEYHNKTIEEEKTKNKKELIKQYQERLKQLSTE